MAIVRFYPDNKLAQVEEGLTILEASKIAGVLIESPCNSEGICGKCKVKLDLVSIKNAVRSDDAEVLSPNEVEQGIVLSCQTKIIGDISAEIVNKAENKTLKILDRGKSFNFELDCYIKKQYKSEINVTSILAGTEFLAYEQGNTEALNFGIVVDIGTTTLVTALVDLNDGKELGSSSALNPQAVHAQDVLSRIKLASSEDGLNLMNSILIAKINTMINEISTVCEVNKDNIYEIILSGNACMLHLAANVSPLSLGKYPYNTVISGDMHIDAAQHGLQISQYGIIYLPAIISAYIGADITSGVLASQLHKKAGIVIFIDIGTNGEMVVGLNGKLTATSTAAGPAFEGMNITYGMRADRGAIEYFNIEDDGNISTKTIGDCTPIGICGSGLIDIIGELVASNIINKSGKIVDPEETELNSTLKERLIKQDNKVMFKVADNIFISQKDIRQVQLAKGAVRAGIDLLLKNKDIKVSNVDQVLIAGSFGYHLRAESLIHIGLLPAEFEGKIEFIGNTSKSGGHAFLLNKTYRKEMGQIAKNIEVIDLANYQDFDKVFVNSISF